MSHGTSDFIQQHRGSGQHPTLQLGQNHLCKDVRAHGPSNFSRTNPQQELYGLGQTESFRVTCGIGWSKPPATAQASSPSASHTLKAEPQQEDTISQWQTPPPGFAEIVRSLCADNPTQVVMGVPPKLDKEQDCIQMVGSTMFFAQLFQDSVSGPTYTDMVTCSMSLVGMGFTPSMVDCSMPTLLGEEDTDSD